MCRRSGFPYEKLAPGPVGSRIAVVDYDESNKCFYDPVDLDHPLIAVNGGFQRLMSGRSVVNAACAQWWLTTS
jgi:hypothetical protein